MTILGRSNAYLLFMAALVLAAGHTIGGGMVQAVEYSHDLDWILKASHHLLDGRNPYLDYQRFRDGLGPDPGFTPSYPPSALVIFWPLSVLYWPAVKILWAAGNLGFTLGSLLILRRLYAPAMSVAPIVVIFLFAVATPAFSDLLREGQFTPVVIYFFLSALAAEKEGRTLPAILWLALALVKYHVTGILALVFLRKDRIGILVGAVLVHIALTILAGAWLWENPLTLVAQNISVNLHENLVVHKGDINYTGVLEYFGAMGPRIGMVLSAIILIGIVVRMVPYRNRDDLLALSCLAAASVLAVFHLLYDLLLLLIPIFYVTGLALDGPFVRLSRVQKIAVVSVLAGPLVLEYPLEGIEEFEPLGTWFTEPLEVASWVAYMVFLTAAFVALYTLVWRDAAQPQRRSSEDGVAPNDVNAQEAR